MLFVIVCYFFSFGKGISANILKLMNLKLKQEGHDGPEVAHLYIGPRNGASLNPGAFI
jgi:hypothetical protein